MGKLGILRSLVLAVCGLFACFGLSHILASEKITESLRRAYGEHRTVTLRLRSTLFSPFRQQRALKTPYSDRPRSLLEAEAAIAQGLRSNPRSSSLLAARGEANLLEGADDSAITDFQQALDLNPRSPYILNGLATAYFERAEYEGKFEDYGTAFELQSRALQLSENDPVLLFNRAITASRLYLYQQSMEDWQHYIALAPADDWIGEAQKRAEKVRYVVEAHSLRRKNPLLTPEEMVRGVSASNPESWEKVESQIEEYLLAATSNWLPSAFPADRKTPSSTAARQALEILALIFRRNHNDSWLTDLLSKTGSPYFGLAVDDLARAVKANNVDYALAQKKAAEAARLFSSSGNRAGEVRARFEGIYAARLSDAGPVCSQQLVLLAPTLEKLPYLRLQAQIHLERYNCMAENGAFDHSDQLEIAYQMAEKNHYRALALRALSMQATDDLFMGNIRSAMRRCEYGLKQYWSGTTTSYPGRAFYTELVSYFQGKQQWHVDAAAAQQDLAIADLQDPLSLAIEHTDLAHALLMAAKPREAQSALDAAQKLLAAAPQTEITGNYRLTVECYSALAFGQSGHADDALARMESIRPQLAHTANTNVVADFYRISGELENLKGNSAAAENDLMTAVALGEAMWRSIDNDAERLSWRQQWAAPYLDLIEAEMEQGKAEDALNLWNLYRGLAVHPSQPSAAEGIEIAHDSTRESLLQQSNLRNHVLPTLKGSSVLVVAVASHGIALWVYDDRGTTARWLRQDPGTVRLQAEQLAKLCAQSSSSLPEIQAAARNLYKLLIAPIEAQLRPNQSLIIETDGALSAVSFQVLIDASGNYLADRHPILYSPGLAYLHDSLAAKIDANSSALIVASAGGPDANLRPLDDAVVEARGVARHFTEPQLLAEDEASLHAIVRHLPSAEIFHFTGHAVANSSRAGLIVSSPKGAPAQNVLDAEALRKVSMPRLSLAVLSACSTEYGTEGDSGNYDSLVRTFLSQEVPHVVATRWNVDSAASEFLMEKFYDDLLAGVPVAQSLARAEAALRQREPHPYYWAPFDAFGQN